MLLSKMDERLEVFVPAGKLVSCDGLVIHALVKGEDERLEVLVPAGKLVSWDVLVLQVLNQC